MEFRKLNRHSFLEVSEDGVIKNTITGTVYAQSKDKDGYWRVRSSHKGQFFDYRTHRAVAEAFVDNPNPDHYKIVNHIDGVKTNNHFSNLEWCTAKYNSQHACSVTMTSRPHNSVSDEVVYKIINTLKSSDLTYKDIGDMFDVSKKTVSNIANGSSYKHITKGERVVDRAGKRFSRMSIEWVCRMFQEGLTVNQVKEKAVNYSFKYHFLYKIYNRMTNTHISDKYVW